MIFALFTALAFAQDEVHAIPAQKSEIVFGPAVWMTEPRFTEFLIAEQNLPICQEGLAKATTYGLTASARAADAFDLASKQFRDDEELIRALQSDNAKLSVEVDELRAMRSRLREQRNVAWGIAGGFLVAATTVTIVALR